MFEIQRRPLVLVFEIQRGFLGLSFEIQKGFTGRVVTKKKATQILFIDHQYQAIN